MTDGQHPETMSKISEMSGNHNHADKSCQGKSHRTYIPRPLPFHLVAWPHSPKPDSFHFQGTALTTWSPEESFNYLGWATGIQFRQI